MISVFSLGFDYPSHPVLYFTTQISEKYSAVMYYVWWKHNRLWVITLLLKCSFSKKQKGFMGIICQIIALKSNTKHCSLNWFHEIGISYIWFHIYFQTSKKNFLKRSDLHQTSISQNRFSHSFKAKLLLLTFIFQL